MPNRAVAALVAYLELLRYRGVVAFVRVQNV